MVRADRLVLAGWARAASAGGHVSAVSGMPMSDGHAPHLSAWRALHARISRTVIHQEPLSAAGKLQARGMRDALHAATRTHLDREELRQTQAALAQVTDHLPLAVTVLLPLLSSPT